MIVPGLKEILCKLYPDSEMINIQELKGGSSAKVTAIELLQPDKNKKKIVVRQVNFKDKESVAFAENEFKLLKNLYSLGLNVPEPYYFEHSGEIIFNTYLIMEYIEGKTEFKPDDLNRFLYQMALCLNKIHNVELSSINTPFLTNQENIYIQKIKNIPENLDDSLSEGKIRNLLEAVWPIPQKNKSVLLHGDFWPGNVLWKNQKIVSIIDWEDVTTGDPLYDLANTRLEILWAFDSKAMDTFTQHYKSITELDFSNLAYYDLCAALKPASKISQWGLEEKTENNMREKHQWFLRQIIGYIDSV